MLAGWVLFRSESLADAVTIYLRVATLAQGIVWWPPLPIAAIGLMVAEHLAWRTKLRRAMRLAFDAWHTPVVVAIMIWCLMLYAPQGFRPFVYFQF